MHTVECVGYKKDNQIIFADNHTKYVDITNKNNLHRCDACKTAARRLQNKHRQSHRNRLNKIRTLQQQLIRLQNLDKSDLSERELIAIDEKIYSLKINIARINLP